MNEVQAGRLRKRLTFTAPPGPDDVTIDSHGQTRPTNDPKGTLWGSVEAVGGREFWQAQEGQVLFTHKVEIRFSGFAQQIGKNWQVNYEGHVLNIQLPPRDPDGRRRKLELLCIEVVIP